MTPLDHQALLRNSHRAEMSERTAKKSASSKIKACTEGRLVEVEMTGGGANKPDWGDKAMSLQYQILDRKGLENS